MSCASQPLTLSQAQLGDLYMDQAIYHSGTDKIYGCRSQWLFKFNATTAVLEASLRTSTNIDGGLSSICAIGTNLYIGTTFAPGDSLSGLNPYQYRDIYIVDTGTFTVTGRFNFDVKLSTLFGARMSAYYHTGWDSIVTDGTLLYGFNGNGDLWKVNPTNLPGYARQSFGLLTDIAFDSFNSVLWVADPFSPNVWCEGTGADWGTATTNNGSSGNVTGICYADSTNKVYVVRGTFELLMADASTAMPGFNNFNLTTFNTGRINANPFKVKAVNGLAGNPYNNKVLIPAFADDTVLIWDPSTDNVANMVVKTGFTSPFDIVNAPTASFALQTGTVGLKAI